MEDSIEYLFLYLYAIVFAGGLGSSKAGGRSRLDLVDHLPNGKNSISGALVQMTFRRYTEDFLVAPNAVLLDSRLTKIQLRILLALISFQDNKSSKPIFAKREKVAARAGGYKLAVVSRTTTELCDLGWLKKFGNGGRSSPCSYLVTIPEHLKTLTDSVSVTEQKTVTDPVSVSCPQTVTDSVSDTGKETLTEPETVTEQVTVNDSETVTEPVRVNEKKTVTDPVTVTGSDTKTVTEPVTKTVTDSVTGKNPTTEPTNKPTSKTSPSRSQRLEDNSVPVDKSPGALSNSKLELFRDYCQAMGISEHVFNQALSDVVRAHQFGITPNQAIQQTMDSKLKTLNLPVVAGIIQNPPPAHICDDIPEDPTDRIFNRSKKETVIPRSFMPSQHALDVLNSDGIGEEFAESLVGEFISYWSESDHRSSTWNSIFIKHARSQWEYRFGRKKTGSFA